MSSDDCDVDGKCVKSFTVWRRSDGEIVMLVYCLFNISPAAVAFAACIVQLVYLRQDWNWVVKEQLWKFRLSGPSRPFQHLQSTVAYLL